MSLSNPRPENPCQKWIRFSGDTGEFSWYDKETEQEIKINLPISFIVLDSLSRITGYHKASDGGINSNEVHDLRKEPLEVYTFKGSEYITGLYRDIKDAVKALGGKFTASVYAVLINEKHLELVNFQFRGAALKSWLDAKINPGKIKTGVTEIIEDSNGSIHFRKPVFQTFKLDDDLYNQAIEMDKKLQEYLASKKEKVEEKASETLSVKRKVDDFDEENFNEVLDAPPPDEEMLQ